MLNRPGAVPWLCRAAAAQGSKGSTGAVMSAFGAEPQLGYFSSGSPQSYLCVGKAARVLFFGNQKLFTISPWSGG